MTLYQIRTKFRDEIRPRFGLMRGREFLMYDGYSFDVDAEGLDRSYKAQDAAYRRIFERCGLDFTVVAGGLGRDRRQASQEFMVLADTGENAVVRCAACGYGANLEKAETGATAGARGRTRPRRRSSRSQTPGKGGIEDVVEFLGITALADDQVPRLRDREGLRRRAAPRRPRGQRGRPQEHARRRAPRARLRGQGREGHGRPGRLRRAAQASRRGRARSWPTSRSATRSNAVTGAGRRDWHVAGFVLRRDANVEAWACFAQARAGDPCPRCGKPLDIARGIEVGHIFKLGTKYSTALRCTFTDEKGETHPAVMGTYGIGVGRTMAAAIEQHHDADGIVWPLALAPFEIAARVAQPSDEATRREADALYEALLGGRARRLLRRPRRAAGRQVQGRGPHRLPDPGERGGPGAEGRQGRGREAPRQEPYQRRDRRRARRWRPCGPSWPARSWRGG